MFKLYTLFLLVYLNYGYSLSFTDPQSLTSHNFVSPYFEYFGKQPPFFIQTSFVSVSPHLLCKQLDEQETEKVVGKVVYVQSQRSCSEQRQARLFQQSGVYGVVFQSNTVGLYSRQKRDSKDTDNIVAVDVDIPTNVITKLKVAWSQNLTVTVEIVPERTPYYNLAVWVPLALLLGLAALGCLILACHRLYRFIQAHGFKLNTPNICLSIEVICALFRITLSLEPVPLYGLFNEWEYYFVYVMSFPLMVAEITLISFYWHQTFQGDSNLNGIKKALKRISIPVLCVAVTVNVLFIVIVILVAQEVDISLIQGLVFGSSLIVALSLSIFYITTAVRVIRFLRGSELNPVTNSRRKLSLHIIAISIAGILMIIPISIPLLINRDMTVFTILFVILFGASIFISYNQILAFVPPVKEQQEFQISDQQYSLKQFHLSSERT